MPAHGYALRILSLALGVFFLFEAIGKLSWFASSSVLRERLVEWVDAAPALSRTYIQTICLPGVEVFARLVPLGEFSVAVAFLLGGYTRLAAALGLLMVLGLLQLAVDLSQDDWSYRHLWMLLPLFYFIGLAVAWRRYR